MHAGTDTTTDSALPRSAMPRWLAALLLLIAAGAIVAIAMWQVGPAPGSVDEGLPEAPPPLALPSDTPDDSPLATAAALLAADQLDEAREAFIGVVAEAPDDVAGQVGLIYSRWRTTGPRSVERDLRQLSAEFPESAHAMLHLGLAQTLVGESRAARETLRAAVELGRDAADPTSLRMARIADDLLHPGMFRGALPVLVAVDEVPKPQRAKLRTLLEAVAADDLRRAGSIASELEDADDGMLRIAAITATFDKQDPEVVPDRLVELAREDVPAAVRDRARFLGALARLWGGMDRAEGCRVLAASTRDGVAAATRRYARPIHTELCGEKAEATERAAAE